jgi:predicted DNA-binding transcriptional regulator YafY/predicted kinase
MKKTVIINRGIPASGKSTFAKNIVKTIVDNGFSAIRCSTDDFFMVDGEYRFDQSKLRRYHTLNQQNFENALKDDMYLVICDNTNIEPWEANVYYQLAKKYNYEVILMDFESRDLDLHLQVQSNDDYNHNIPQEVLEDMYQRYSLFEELTQKSSYPTSKHLKKYYDESTKQVQTLDEYSEPFYYDKLIKVSSEDFEALKDRIGNLVLDKMKEYLLEDIKLIPKEYKIIMQEISKSASKTITAYELKDRLGKSPKQIERYLGDLMREFHNLIEFKEGRKKAYKLIDDFDAFIEAFQNMDEFNELFYLAQESNPKLFKKLEFQFNKNDIFLFKNTIFETVQNQEIFNNLKTAIKANEYRIIKLKDAKEQEVKCIKLVFVDNNWYLAYVDSDDALRLARVSFIESVKYASKNSFQKSSIKKHLNELETKLQNAMTRFDKEQQIATIKATSQVAKYFEKDMKKFLLSQEFQEKLDDGSVIFTVSYTQPLEILPFIQKWLPDLIILEPQELKEHYKEKLQKTLNNLS